MDSKVTRLTGEDQYHPTGFPHRKVQSEIDNFQFFIIKDVQKMTTRINLISINIYFSSFTNRCIKVEMDTIIY